MSVDDHRATSPSRVGCAVLTISDTRTPDTDTSGRAIVDLLAAAGHEIAARRLVPDSPALVGTALSDFAHDAAVRVIVCTGGTGITTRDGTLEAASALFDTPLPGFGELFRMLSYEAIGAAAMLTRAAAGIINQRAVFLLPGSEHAVRLGMTKLILPELGHLARELSR